MKIETYHKAQELQVKIEDLNQAINEIETNKKHPCTGAFPLNLSFCFDEEKEDFKKSVLSYLKSKRLKYTNQFDNLK